MFQKKVRKVSFSIKSGKPFVYIQDERRYYILFIVLIHAVEILYFRIFFSIVEFGLFMRIVVLRNF